LVKHYRLMRINTTEVRVRKSCDRKHGLRKCNRNLLAKLKSTDMKLKPKQNEALQLIIIYERKLESFG
jgi:hypothetical protein